MKTLGALLVLVLCSCCALAASEDTLSIGDPEKKVRRLYGRPMGAISRGKDKIMMFRDGEVTLRDGKVVSVSMSDRNIQAPPEPASAKSAASGGTGPAPTSSRTARTSAGKWDPGPVPDYAVLSRLIRQTARQHRIAFSQDELKKEIELAWTRHTRGANAPDRSWADQVRFRRLERGTRKDFDSKNKAEYTGSVKYQRGGRWVYQHALPPGDARTCWKKYSTSRHVGRSVSGDQATDYYMGTQSSWYRLDWDAKRKRWFWLPKAERDRFVGDFRKQLQNRIIRSRKTPIPKARGGYTDLSQVVRAHSREFETRSFERFLDDLDTIAWPDP